MAAVGAPCPTLTSLCLASILESLPRFCIRAGDSIAAVECLAPSLLKALLQLLAADRCEALRRRRGDAAAWASAAAALVSALSASDAAFAATLVLTRPEAGRGLLMLSACANLRVLSLRGVATDAAVQAAASCKHLARLDASRSPSLSAAAAAALAAGHAAATLAVLQVAGCAGVDDAFVAVAAALPALRHLDVSDCAALSDAALAHLLRRRPPLACLRVARCAGVRARAASASACWTQALQEALPGLACLDGAGTPGLLPCARCASARPRLQAAPPAPEASAIAALSARGLAPQQQLAERRALAHAWGGASVAALADAAAEAEAGGKRRRDAALSAADDHAAWAGGAMSAARIAPWARAAPDVGPEPWLDY